MVKFHTASYNTFRDINYYLVNYLVEFWFVEFWSSHGQTESDAYEPTVQFAQVGSKMKPLDVDVSPPALFGTLI